MSSASDEQTGVVDDPSGDGFQIGGEITETAAAGIGMLIDLIAAIFRLYLITSTSLLIVIFVLMVVVYFVGQWPSKYGTKMQLKRTRRAGWGIFMVSIILPLLYFAMWIGTGSQSTEGTSLPADGVFGTPLEDRIIGPNPDSGGLGMLSSVFGELFHTYRFTITFLFVIILVFFIVGYYFLQWPQSTDPFVRKERVYRAGVGALASLSILPILYAIGWVATGWHTPDKSFTRVAPQIQLPFDDLFVGVREHPFMRDLAATPDPMEAAFHSFMSFQVTTMMFVGILAIASGALAVLLAHWSEYINFRLDQRTIKGGVIILLVAFFAPGLVAGSAWIASGMASHGAIGDGPPGFAAECYDFGTGGLETWTVAEGSVNPQSGGVVELHGTLEKSYPETILGDKYVSVQGEGGGEIHVRIYENDELVLEESTSHTGSYTVPVENETRVEIESDGGKISEACVGWEPSPEPNIVIGMNTDEEIILRNGLDSKLEVFSVGSVGTTDDFAVEMTASGNNYEGEPAQVSESWTIEPLGGGEFRKFDVHFQELIEARTIGEVQITSVVDPENELDQRTQFGNVDDRTITILYADLHGNIERPEGVVYGNETSVLTEVVNKGTAFSERTTADVRILNEENETVTRWTQPLDELDPDERVEDQFTHEFTVPGEYVAVIDVDHALFPEGTVNRSEFEIAGSDLRTELSGVDDESRIESETAFDVTLSNQGNREASASKARLEIVDASGDVAYSELIDVPALSEGEEFTESITTTLDTTGSHTVRVAADDPDFPIGNTDSDRILVVGPDLQTDLSASGVYENDTVDITATVTNDGNDDSNPTTGEVSLYDPDGNLVQTKTVDVDGLSPGERQTFSPFDVVADQRGEYSVEMDVDTEFSPEGSADETDFLVKYVDLELDINTEPVPESNSVEATVTVENHGTGQSDPVTVDVTFRNESGAVETVETVYIGRVGPGDVESETIVVELEESGEYTVEAETDDDDGDSESGESAEDEESFTNDWPDLAGKIVANETEVSGLETTVNTTITNVGAANSSPTSAEVVVYDSFGNVVDEHDIGVPSIVSNESVVDVIDITFPGPGTYVAEIDVEDEEYPDNTVDETKEIEVLHPELTVEVSPVEEKILPGDTAELDVIVENVGSANSTGRNTTVVIENPDGDIVHRDELSLGIIEPGENSTVRTSTPLEDGGVYGATAEVETVVGDVLIDDAEVEVLQPELDIEVSPVEEEIMPGGTAELVVIVENVGLANSTGRNTTVVVENSDGDIVHRDELSLGVIESGENSTVRTSTPLEDVGVHGVEAEVETAMGDVLTGDSEVDVLHADLRVDVTAENIHEGEETVIETIVENHGSDTNVESNATVSIMNETGAIVAESDYNISPLEPGESRVGEPIMVTLNETGQYEVSVDIETQYAPEGSSDQTRFRVLYWDLTAELVGYDESDVNEVQFRATITNDGTGWSNTSTGKIVIRDPSGRIVHQGNFSVPELRDGRSFSETVTETVNESGTYTAEVSVVDQDRPSGTVATAEAQITWPNLEGQITPTESVVEGSDTEFVVLVDNVGPGESEPTTASVAVLDEFGNVVDRKIVDVPRIQSGDSYQLMVPHTFVRPGTYYAEVNVDHSEFAEGTVDSTDAIEVVHGNLIGEIEFEDGVSEVGTPAPVNLIVENGGNHLSSPTTATFEIVDGDGELVVDRELDIEGLETGESTVFSLSPVLNASGMATATLDIDDPEFPVDTKDQDRIEIVAPDLRVDLSISDVEMGNEADAVITVRNVGETQSDATVGQLEIDNTQGWRVVNEEVSIPSLAPGESEEIVYSQPIKEKCWMTEMSCEPGAEMDYGTYSAQIDVVVEFYPRGTVDEATFTVD